MAGLDALWGSIQGKLSGTAKLRLIGLTKIPLFLFCSPSVEEFSEERVRVRLPLTWRNKNHLGSMYFAVLCLGADLAGGVQAWEWIQEFNEDNRRQNKTERMALVFKEFNAKFLKRPYGDVIFECAMGPQIRALINAARDTKERVNLPLDIRAFSQKTAENPAEMEEVAQFVLTLSLKVK